MYFRILMVKNYHVLAGYDDTKEAADKMARVNIKMLEFLDFLKKKYKVNTLNKNLQNKIPDVENLYSVPAEKMLSENYKIVDRILENYNFEVIHENTPTGRDGTSYTIDKGEKLRIVFTR